MIWLQVRRKRTSTCAQRLQGRRQPSGETAAAGGRSAAAEVAAAAAAGAVAAGGAAGASVAGTEESSLVQMKYSIPVSCSPYMIQPGTTVLAARGDASLKGLPDRFPIEEWVSVV